MVIKEDPNSQFADLPFTELVFDESHPLLRLSGAINWEALLEELSRFYKEGRGRPSTPLRAQAGTLILKFVKNLPDREAVHCVMENIYAQRFCNLLPCQIKDYMHPASGLANFRAKIGPEGMALIEAVIEAAAGKKPLKRGNKIIIDTSCVPLDIHYPTDIKLLERCRRKIIKLINEAKGLGLKDIAYRTYNRTARKVFASFSKKSKPKEKTRKKAHKQMFQFVRRNFRQLADLRKKAARQLGPLCRLNPEISGWLKEIKVVETRVRTILHQQKLVRRGIVHISGRIVSFHKDHIRPIVRGKFPLDTEFGPKVLFAVVKGCFHVVGVFQDNVADANLVVPALRWFKKTFGRLPSEALGDRGFYAGWRSRLIRGFGIEPGFEARGRQAGFSASRRQRRQRLAVEARISLFKRKFGGSRCRAKNNGHEESWIRLGAAAMNAHLVYRYDTS